MEKLSKVLGHYSVVMTERYAHLRPDPFAERDFATSPLNLAGEGVLTPLGQHLGSAASQVRASLPQSLKKRWSRPVSRVLSRGKPRGGEHSSRTRVAARLQRAVPGGADRASLSPHPLARAGAPLREASLFALAPGGVCRAAPVAGGAVRSYRTVSPLPRAPRGAVRRSALCCTFLRVTPTGRWPAPCPVVPGLSSAALSDRRVRPDGSSESNIARARRPGKRRTGERLRRSG